MAYIETIFNMHLQFVIMMAANKQIGDSKPMDTVYKKIERMRISEVLQMLFDMQQIEKEFKNNLGKLFDKRNQLIHDVVSHVMFNVKLDDSLTEPYEQAFTVLETEIFKSWTATLDQQFTGN